MSAEDRPDGMIEEVCRKFNLSPADAERAIADAEAVNGPAAFGWLVRELRRLHRDFIEDDAPTADEIKILTALATRADHRGRVRISRRDLADAAELRPEDVMNADSWGTWRRSFRVRRVSEPGTPYTGLYQLNNWPPPRGT